MVEIIPDVMPTSLQIPIIRTLCSGRILTLHEVDNSFVIKKGFNWFKDIVEAKGFGTGASFDVGYEEININPLLQNRDIHTDTDHRINLAFSTAYILAGTIFLLGIECPEENKVAISDVVEWTGDSFSPKLSMPTALGDATNTRAVQALDGQCIKFNGRVPHAAPPLPEGTRRLLFSAWPE